MPFKKGNPGGPGRPRGAKDRFTREIKKKALLDAVEFVGEELAEAEAQELKKQGRVDPNAPRGITAYLVHVAENHPQVMCALK
jgi:hypothetical protein